MAEQRLNRADTAPIFKADKAEISGHLFENPSMGVPRGISYSCNVDADAWIPARGRSARWAAFLVIVGLGYGAGKKVGQSVESLRSGNPEQETREWRKWIIQHTREQQEP